MSRIYQYPVVTEIGSDDYLALGSVNGSRSILASNLAPVIGNKTITERGTYKASDDNMDGYGQVTVDIPYTDIHVASGDIATFEGEDLPLKSLKVAVTPYQDLHGYDAPWAGGAGKNKLKNTATSTTRGGITFTVNTNGSVTVSGTATEAATLELGTLSVRQGETYTISGSISAYDSFQSQLFCRSETAFPRGSRLQSYSGLSKTATALADETTTIAIYVYEGTSINGTFYPQIELGSTATTFAPYSNICPIIGWDEAVVTVADDVDNPTVSHEYTIDLNGTRYGGTLDATNGTMDDTLDYIASYNGETLPSTWISDRDVYAEGTTPTVGAEVVYTRANPITVQLSPTQVKSLEGENNIFANCGAVDVEYQTVWVRPSN